jgi:hypothetical protein
MTHYTKTQLFNNQIYTIDNVISKPECDDLILRANKKGWNKSSPSGGGHGRTGREDARTNSFCVFEDPEFVLNLFTKIKHTLPKDLTFLGDNVYFNSVTKGAEWTPKFIYDKLRIYKYEVGEAFPEHIDYKVKRNIIDTTTQKEYCQQSFLTLLIYLNDDFIGGETGYWPIHNGIHCRFLRNMEKQLPKKNHQVSITPKIGMCVVQDQNILHEGIPTTKGTKYILRTDIIHQKGIIRHNKVSNSDKNKSGEWERLFETSCKNYAD